MINHELIKLNLKVKPHRIKIYQTRHGYYAEDIDRKRVAVGRTLSQLERRLNNYLS